MKVPQSRLTRRTFCAASAGLAAFGFNRMAAADEPEAGKVITQLAKFKLNMEKEAEGLQGAQGIMRRGREKRTWRAGLSLSSRG